MVTLVLFSFIVEAVKELKVWISFWFCIYKVCNTMEELRPNKFVHSASMNIVYSCIFNFFKLNYV